MAVCDIDDILVGDLIALRGAGGYKPSSATTRVYQNIVLTFVFCFSDCSGAKSVQVDIVKGFQGREKHVIVISATRDSKEGIGSFSEPEKFNVALTRAKHCLIICGHMATLRRNDLWNKLVTDAEKRELFYRVDSYSNVDDKDPLSPEDAAGQNVKDSVLECGPNSSATDRISGCKTELDVVIQQPVAMSEQSLMIGPSVDGKDLPYHILLALILFLRNPILTIVRVLGRDL
ncbi:hypothetical protein QYM36_016495 [Artemia franciscana]|uniref:DNA2/NAM7 helicase-like C-terminal domain-containing protein n=1 Tax=Artemia franciscana TaxID=6661 RepID=A0AA88KY85_ARTSF|nr:hypothetical protein QYM36_016495 [Artemia franciscana]